MSIKINNCFYSNEDAAYEFDIYKKIASAGPDHAGKQMIRQVWEKFEISSPLGTHICFVQEAMREPMYIFKGRVAGKDRLGKGWPVFKVHLALILEGLDFLNSEAKTIHTGI